MPKITQEELINDMFKEACRFVEFYSRGEMTHYKGKGFTGKNPDKFHPGLADKFILRKLMEEHAGLTSEDWRTAWNAPIFAQRILMNCYYNVFS
jgi:hypothetical protein